MTARRDIQTRKQS